MLATAVNEQYDIRTLKRQLHKLSGIPRFRQRLLNDGAVLEDAAQLDGPADLQLLLLPFCSTTYEQVIELHEAVANGKVSVLEQILQRPQNPDLQLEDGSDWDRDEEGIHFNIYRHAPLTVASGAGATELVQLLLEAGADKDGLFEMDDRTAFTPLCAACACSLEIVSILLKSGAQPNGISKTGATKPLCVAARAGNLSIVRTLLEANADKEATDGSGETALCKASRHGHLNVARFLLEVGADIEAVFGVGRGYYRGSPSSLLWRPLWAAACCGNVDIVRVLLSARADTEAKTRYGETPLLAASRQSRIEIVRLLLRAGACTDAGDNHGETPLCAASATGSLPVVQLLLEAGADPTLSNNRGETPDGIAANAGHAQVCCKLLRDKAKVADAAQLESRNKRQKSACRRASKDNKSPSCNSHCRGFIE